MRVRTRPINDNKAYVAVLGPFDFSLHQEFRAAIDSLAQAEICQIDLRETSSLDSSALGMLSVAKRQFKRLEITDPKPEIRDTLIMAGFSESTGN
ncbi:MAG: STAS domain-containing protein [Myxococcota bacterium]